LFGAGCSVSPEFNLRLQLICAIFGRSELH
jgi:hypothetical protein